MKKITIQMALIIFIALMSHPTLTAQNDPVSVAPDKKFAIGINFGRMVSDYWFIGEDYSDRVPVKARTSFNWGILFNITTSEHTSISTAFLLNEKGREFDPDHPKTNLLPLPSNGECSPFDFMGLDYLVASQSLLFNTKSRVVLYTGPGIYQAFLIAKNEYSELFPPQPQPHKFDLGFSLTTGIRFILHPSIQANIEVNATSGVRPIFSRTTRRIYFHGDDQKTISLNKTLSGNFTLSYRF